MNKPKFSFIDLFAGIGGFRLALEKNGGRCVGFSEIASDAIASYCKNYNESPDSNLGDITKLRELPDHDFLTGGVPCQSWSIAGRNLGFDDSRGQLWNDALFLLNQSKPKAFIFENVKGLADPRNKEALNYIMERIKNAGYHASFFLLNAYDYGVPQNRIRIYIIGFREKIYHDRFSLPQEKKGNATLNGILSGTPVDKCQINHKHGFGQSISVNSDGRNDYFLFNDLRGGETTIHSWDLVETSDKEKMICNLLLQNRRKRCYGPLDGNPMALQHFKELDSSISIEDLNGLVTKGILKEEKYRYIIKSRIENIDIDGIDILNNVNSKNVNIDELKLIRDFKIRKINVTSLLNQLAELGLAECVEIRYDFKNTKISTGLNGINRIFLPSSKLYPTLVASDTNDYISEIDIHGATSEEYRRNFLEKVYKTKKYRLISKEEACIIQGFPKNFILPESRPRWMKLIGNSVAVTLISQLAESIVATGVFDENDYDPIKSPTPQVLQQSLFD